MVTATQLVLSMYKSTFVTCVNPTGLQSHAAKDLGQLRPGSPPQNLPIVHTGQVCASTICTSKHLYIMRVQMSHTFNCGIMLGN